MALLIRRHGEGSWHEPLIQHYVDESALQALLTSSPGLLPGVDEQRCIVAREVHLGEGYADVVVVDADGVITVVECKLRTNPDIRRTVVGQLLAYAAGLWRLSYDDFDARLSACHASLAGLVDQIVDEPETARASLRQAISDNLFSGRFRLVIAVDHITAELRSIIEYLNMHTIGDVQVLGFELGYVADEGVEVIIPSVYGEETAARGPRPSAARRSTEEDLLAAIDTMPEAVRDGFIRLFEHARGHPRFDHWYWGVGKSPSVTPWLISPGGYTQPWTIFVSEGGKEVLAVNFDWIHRRGAGFPADVVRRFAHRIKPVIDATEQLDRAEQDGWRRRPSLPAAQLFSHPDAADLIINALNEMYDDEPSPASPTP